MELTENEKRTLSWMLKEKIHKTHETEDVIRKTLTSMTEDMPKEMLRDSLEGIYEQRQNCYEIARKLNIK